MQNIGIKLVCLAFALLLWMQVASTVDMEQIVRLPLEISGLPDSLVVETDHLPESIAVRVRGSRLQMLMSDVIRRDLGHVELDLEDLDPAHHRYDVSVLDVRTSGTPLEIVPPVSLDIHVQRRLRKYVAVRLQTQGELSAGLTFVSPVEVAPTQVELIGPESLLEQLSEVDTKPLRLDRVRSSFSERIELVGLGPDVDIIPVEVEVSAGVDEVVQREFEDIPVTLLREVESKRLVLEPTVARVTVGGARNRVMALGAEEISVLIHVAADARGVLQIPAEVTLPDGVTLRGVEPVSFQVFVDVDDSDGVDG